MTNIKYDWQALLLYLNCQIVHNCLNLSVRAYAKMTKFFIIILELITIYKFILR